VSKHQSSCLMCVAVSTVYCVMMMCSVHFGTTLLLRMQKDTRMMICALLAIVDVLWKGCCIKRCCRCLVAALACKTVVGHCVAAPPLCWRAGPCIAAWSDVPVPSHCFYARPARLASVICLDSTSRERKGYLAVKDTLQDTNTSSSQSIEAKVHTGPT
jgi:hypothetical protein